MLFRKVVISLSQALPQTEPVCRGVQGDIMDIMVWSEARLSLGWCRAHRLSCLSLSVSITNPNDTMTALNL